MKKVKIVSVKDVQVQANKEWQDSGLKMGNVKSLATVRAETDAYWAFTKNDITNMDGLYCSVKGAEVTHTNDYYNSKVAVNEVIPSDKKSGWVYKADDAKVGQLLFKIGENGNMGILGRNTLVIDPNTDEKKQISHLHVNPKNHNQDDSLFFRMNENVSYMHDNTGSCTVSILGGFDSPSVPVVDFFA